MQVTHPSSKVWRLALKVLARGFLTTILLLVLEAPLSVYEGFLGFGYILGATERHHSWWPYKAVIQITPFVWSLAGSIYLLCFKPRPFFLRFPSSDWLALSLRLPVSSILSHEHTFPPKLSIFIAFICFVGPLNSELELISSKNVLFLWSKKNSVTSNTLGKCGEIYALYLSNASQKRKMSKTVVSIIKQVECSYPVTYVNALETEKWSRNVKKCKNIELPPRLGKCYWNTTLI